MTENESIIDFIKVGTFILVYVTKTPKISVGGSIRVGVQNLISSSACPIILGDTYNRWNAFIRISSGEVTIFNSDSKEIPNAYYKGCCIMK